MSFIISDFLLFLIVVMAAFLGFKEKSLTRSGAFASVLVGLAIIAAFGFKGLVLLGAFFVTSSLWSKFKLEKKQRVEDKLKKSGARDAVQVFANGGVPAILSLLYLMFHSELLLYMFICALATANSDTWASEIGSVSKRQPIHILTFRKVDAGTSGAVSLLGTLAALCGAFLIGIIGLLLWNELPIKAGIMIAIVGFIGNLFDTILGATVQVTFVCPNCGLITEKTMHCQARTVHKSGFLMFNNDTVNFLSIALGSLLILFLL